MGNCGSLSYISMKSWLRISGIGVERLKRRLSVLNFAMMQNFLTRSCASWRRIVNAPSTKCSETPPRACRTEARSFRTTWSFSQSGPSAIARVAAGGSETAINRGKSTVQGMQSSRPNL